MTDRTDEIDVPGAGESDYVPYDRRKLSYAGTFANPWKAGSIRVLEWLTGKAILLRRIRAFEAAGVVAGQGFWPRAMTAMGIEVLTPPVQLANIPPDGPVVVVANHPHGLVDGMVLAHLIGQVRTDYKILTRSLLTGVPEVARFMIAVPFPHEPDSFQRFLDMRRQASGHLERGGLVAVFPSGAVASAQGWMGPAIEAAWNPFTAKLIRGSGATVVPVYFPGQNSRAYQWAAKCSATLRQGLLLHEVVHALDRPQAPVIGPPIGPAEIEPWKDRPGAFIGWLRQRTLALRA